MREKFYIILVAAYLTVVLFSYVYYGVVFQFTLGMISLALLPVTVLLGQTKQYLREFTPFLILLLSYEALQGLAGTLAISHGIASLYPLDVSLWGTNLTGEIQRMFYSSFLTQITTLLYSLHFPMVAISAVLLWYSSKLYYKRYVYALLICSYFSLLVFLIMPTAPPWYIGAATNLVQQPQSSSPLAGFFSSINSLTSSIESDKFAAFPSLHGAYAILFAYFTTRIKRVYGLVSIPVAMGVLFSTLYLGQHYLIDLIAGSVVAFSSIIISIKISNFNVGQIEQRIVISAPRKASMSAKLRARFLSARPSEENERRYPSRK
ncbi:MAG: phosphatase PAP2 family protein [Nitrososphaerales archaeon]